MTTVARVAAIQIEAAIADVDANLAACERLADRAGADGARWIVLPDRFWLHRRGALPAITWSYQRLHGRRWYRRHVRRPPARGERREESVPA